MPIVPDEWKYQVSAGTRKQFGVLRQLMKRDDVESLVCATDAGREGELIFRLVYHQCCCKKPFERLWISSMEDSAIREGFANLKPSAEYDALYEAALSRERADWIVSINAHLSYGEAGEGLQQEEYIRHRMALSRWHLLKQELAAGL